MKRNLDPFRALPFLELEERAESASCTDTDLYIGTSAGNLLQYELAWGGGSPEEISKAARRLGGVRLSQRRPVEQVHALGGVICVLVDGVVNVLPADIQAFAGTTLCREAKLLCPHTGAQDAGTEICVSLRKKLVFFTHNGRNFEQRQEFQAPDSALAMAWHQSWVCIGCRKEYILYSDRNGVPRKVLDLDGKIAPQITLIGHELLLLVQESKASMMNLATQQLSQPSLAWPRKVARCFAVGGFVLGSSGQGQIDVFTVRDYRNCQTLALEGSTVTMCAAPGGRALVVAEMAVRCLDPVPFQRQQEKFMMQVRVGDALDLLNATFGPDDPERERQLSLFHSQAGWALFRDLQFLAAFQHFTYSSDFKIAEVLVLWKGHLPAKFNPQDLQVPAEADIDDFIRARLREKQPSEVPGDSAVSANKDLANAGLVSFLLKHRGAFLAEERDKHRPPAASDKGDIMQAVDTVLLKVLVEMDQDDHRLQLLELLESGVRCSVEDCEGLLRSKKRLDVLARLWKEQGMHEMVLREWGALLRGLEAGDRDAAEVAGSLHITKPQIASEMCSALRGAASAAGGAELLRQYIPELLKIDESAVLPVFTGPVPPGCPARHPLSAEEVLDLLQGHNAVALAFLEHLVSSKRDVKPWHCAKLASMYISQVGEEPRAPGAAPSPLRQKLIRFLEDEEDIDIPDLLTRVEGLALHEERVVLHCRRQQHHEALRLLVEALNDLPRAEVYCRVVMAQQRQQMLGPPSCPRVSVFCAEPPRWACAVAFGPRPGEEDEEPPPLPHRQAQQSSDGQQGQRPLMIFLQVLLDASSHSAQRPGDYPKVAAEYREAALSLLGAYAGHPEMPPGEVVGLLPADWTLESLAGYLAKAARTCLHEQRVSMLEKKLSSMAYLKTFSVLAEERSRKVTITGDRCCPGCNRRFVDKDAVAKAFVAYPNETCVHLQCKKDLSICPKTGVSFADNLSVYCNALSGT